MATVDEVLALAVGHHQAGRLAEAEELYRRILAVLPDHADALNLLGVAAAQASRFDEALVLIDRAIAGGHSEAQANRDAVARNRARAVAEAGAQLARGDTLAAAGQWLDAAAACHAAVGAWPEFAGAWLNLGNALQALGQGGSAVEAYRTAATLRPDRVGAHYNLGEALQRLGRFAEAEAAFRDALARQPDLAAAHANLGCVVHAQGRAGEAVACHRRALALQPDLAEAWLNLGGALRDLGRGAAAAACYRQALALRPEWAEAHANLGMTLKDQGEAEAAAESFERALVLGLDDGGRVLGLLAQQERHLCRWHRLADLSQRLLAVVRGAGPIQVNPFAFLAEPAGDAADQLRCARAYAAARTLAAAGFDVVGPARRPDRSRLRIGYLSADFQQHATAVLMAELIELHDRGRFEVFGYSYGADDGGPLRARLSAGFDRFVDVSGDAFAEAARRIHADGVDILVDLKGYTQGARPEIAALRPAPVQVAWLGYPGTLGADFIDYAVVDPIVAPAAHQPFFTERLVHLPDCYQVNDRQRLIAAAPPARAACGLPERGFVFACFNNAYKITPAVFDVWMRLLAAVPDSVLWLLETHPTAAANLRRAASARGVAPERLVFAPRRPLPEYLAQYRLADLFLDTLPINAHTTASDALWAGLPVLTCRGATLVGRVAASLLHAVGLPELVTDSLAGYEALALWLARRPAELADLRRRLAAARDTASLFDSARFARQLERAFETMWAIHRAGEPPRPFAVAPAVTSLAFSAPGP